MGRSIDRFCHGDTWEIRFDNDLWLVTHELRIDAESDLQTLLESGSTALHYSVDPRDAVRSLLLASLMRRPVISVDITTDGALSLHFDEARSVTLPTDTDVVDWQWSLGGTPNNPYAAEALICCLWRGEVRVGAEGVE